MLRRSEFWCLKVKLCLWQKQYGSTAFGQFVPLFAGGQQFCWGFWSGCETYQKGLFQTYDEIKGKIQEASGVVKLNDVSVTPDAFVSDSTYEQYPLRADITDPDIREDMVPNVCFNLDDATSGNYAPVADCAAGTLHIYAKEKPTSTLIIPSIVLE